MQMVDVVLDEDDNIICFVDFTKWNAPGPMFTNPDGTQYSLQPGRIHSYRSKRMWVPYHTRTRTVSAGSGDINDKGICDFNDEDKDCGHGGDGDNDNDDDNGNDDENKSDDVDGDDDEDMKAANNADDGKNDTNYTADNNQEKKGYGCHGGGCLVWRKKEKRRKVKQKKTKQKKKKTKKEKVMGYILEDDARDDNRRERCKRMTESGAAIGYKMVDYDDMDEDELDEDYERQTGCGLSQEKMATEKAVCVVCGVGVYYRTKGGGSCKSCNVWTKTSRAVYICDQDNCRDFNCLSCYNSVR